MSSQLARGATIDIDEKDPRKIFQSRRFSKTNLGIQNNLPSHFRKKQETTDDVPNPIEDPGNNNKKTEPREKIKSV